MNPAKEQPAPRPVPERLGRFSIVGELGQGSMATLYLGRADGPAGFERLFALKVIHPHLSRHRDFMDMFTNEARIAARLRHPNVVSVYDVELNEAQCFIAMDYISGETLGATLAEALNQSRPPSLAIVSHIVAAACEGLHAAHELKSVDGEPVGVVHRDVAPQNILIGYDGAVRITDFGIAKAQDRLTETNPGVLRGTIAYMAPEQVRCEAVDRRADVFAVGVVLWEATVGMRLFRDRTAIGTAARVLRLPVPPPSSIRAGYPERLEAIVLRALERDPSSRYPSARTLGDDLHEFLRGSGARVSPSQVETFMKDLFCERYAARMRMEQLARTPNADANPAPQQILDSVGLARFDDVGPSAAELAADDGGLERALTEVAAIPAISIALPPPTESSRGTAWRLAVVVAAFGLLAAVIVVTLGRLTPAADVATARSIRPAAEPSEVAVQRAPEPAIQPAPEATIEPKPKRAIELAPPPASDADVIPALVTPRVVSEADAPAGVTPRARNRPRRARRSKRARTGRVVRSDEASRSDAAPSKAGAAEDQPTPDRGPGALLFEGDDL